MAEATTNQWSIYRHGRRWTKRDDNILETMFRDHEEPIAIAKKLYRKESAVFDRLKSRKFVCWDKETNSYKRAID